MPFVTANERKQIDLTKFYNDHIKDPIETDRSIDGEYVVNRSSDDFSILDNILLELASADIVICDLSGATANANVVFELGIRLSTSHKPVILIRQDHPSNRTMFDLQGMHTYPYSLNDTKALEKYLIKKIGEYRDRVAKFESPVLKTLNHEAAFWMQLPIKKAAAFLGGIASAAEANLRAFTRALDLYSRRKGIEQFHIADPMTVYRTIDQFSDNSVIFDEFHYAIGTIPSLESYLSSVYLLGLLEDGLEKKFRTYAMNYSLFFNKGNAEYFWENKWQEIYNFAAETLLLMNMCRSLIRVLKSKQGSDEREKLNLEFNGFYEKSKLGDNNG